MEKMKNHFKSQIAKLRKYDTLHCVVACNSLCISHYCCCRDISQKANETKRLQLQLHKAKGANEDETTAEIEALRKDKATLASKLKRVRSTACLLSRAHLCAHHPRDSPQAKAMAASAEEAVAKSQEELKAQLAAKDEEFAAATAAAEATTTKQAATVANLEVRSHGRAGGFCVHVHAHVPGSRCRALQSDLKLMYKRHKSELAELKRQLKTNAYETRLAELVAENQRLSDTLQGLEGLIPDLERVADLQQQYDVELLQARGAQARLTSGGTTLRQQRAELSEAQATIARLEAQLEASVRAGCVAGVCVGSASWVSQGGVRGVSPVKQELARVEAVVNSTADVLAEACLGQVLTSSCDHVERNTMAMEREAVASEVANLRACMQAAAVEKAEREEFAAMEQQVLTEALEEARKQVDDAQQQVATLTAQVEGAKAAAAEAEQRARAASSAREAQQETSASNAAEIASLKVCGDIVKGVTSDGPHAQHVHVRRRSLTPHAKTWRPLVLASPVCRQSWMPCAHSLRPRLSASRCVGVEASVADQATRTHANSLLFLLVIVWVRSCCARSLQQRSKVWRSWSASSMRRSQQPRRRRLLQPPACLPPKNARTPRSKKLRQRARSCRSRSRRLMQRRPRPRVLRPR